MDMKAQEQTNWCWAAVAAAIHNFLNAETPTTQGTVATPVLVDAQKIPDGVDCTTNPELCNFPAALDKALTVTGNLTPGGFKRNHFLFFNGIKRKVDQHVPIGARVVWASGGAHFVAIDGYREFSSGAQFVSVQDPATGPKLIPYEELLSNYPDDAGNWQDTYIVQRNGA